MKFFSTILILAGLALAQTERGQIAGLVSDATGAAVAGAHIVVTNKGTNTPLAITTGGSGDYTAPNLSPGQYRIEIVASGFKKFIQDNVTVNASASVRIDAKLQLGQVSESIEVTTSVAQIQTENARAATSVSNKMVDELPLVVGGEMRNPFGLVAIAPEAKGSGSRLSLGGGQARAWNATMDGLSIATNRAADATEIAYTAPSLEAITEFSVDTNGFKAEYGQAGGGSIADRKYKIITLDGNLKNNPIAATQMLWDTYHPQVHVWIPFALIGVVAAVALWVFGRMARKWKDMNA